MTRPVVQIKPFQKGSAAYAQQNNATGGRARKSISQLTKLFKDFRKEFIKQGEKYLN